MRDSRRKMKILGLIWDVEFEGNIQYEDPIIERYIANQRPSFWKRLRGENEKGMVIDEFEIRKRCNSD